MLCKEMFAKGILSRECDVFNARGWRGKGGIAPNGGMFSI
jgi:hypothetical protein